MTFSRLMIEKTFPYSDKIHDYSSISNELFDVTTVSLVPMLSFLFHSTLTVFVLVIDPAGCDSCQKKAFETKQKLP